MSNQPSILTDCLQVLLRHPAKRYWVGYSGGRDSHVLLDILWRLRQTGHLTQPIVAIHVNHGLNPLAQTWVSHCQQVCLAYHLPLHVETVTCSPKPSESIEAFAREQRYQLIQQHLHHDEVFLSAHHQGDQAETVLLQLMRGAGLVGLRAMPEQKNLGKGRHLRPLLAVDAKQIVHYAEEKALKVITDDSNQDQRFDRNYIRHQVMPILEKRFPQAQQQIARSAQWLSEVEETSPPKTLSIKALQKDTPAVQKEKIRSYCRHKTGFSLTLKQTAYVLQHFLTASADKQPTLVLGEYLLRRYRDEILLTAALPLTQLTVFKQSVLLPGQTVQNVLGRLAWQKGEGLPPTVGPLHILPLSGALRFHPHHRRHSTTVKKLLYEADIMPWLRPYAVGLYNAVELVAIPGVGVSKKYYQKSPDCYCPLWLIRQKFVKL